MGVTVASYIGVGIDLQNYKNGINSKALWNDADVVDDDYFFKHYENNENIVKVDYDKYCGECVEVIYIYKKIYSDDDGNEPPTMLLDDIDLLKGKLEVKKVVKELFNLDIETKDIRFKIFTHYS